MVAVLLLGQLAMWCACGRALSISRASAGRCRVCQRRTRLSREKFGGERERALRRDGEACLVCGAIDDILCHHRRRASNRAEHFATLCRGDHTRVHHLRRLHFHHPERLKEFWRELHADCIDQLELPFTAERPAEQLAFTAA